jgi:hypothetical protein
MIFSKLGKDNTVQAQAFSITIEAPNGAIQSLQLF